MLKNLLNLKWYTPCVELISSNTNDQSLSKLDRRFLNWANGLALWFQTVCTFEVPNNRRSVFKWSVTIGAITIYRNILGLCISDRTNEKLIGFLI